MKLTKVVVKADGDLKDPVAEEDGRAWWGKVSPDKIPFKFAFVTRKEIRESI